MLGKNCYEQAKDYTRSVLIEPYADNASIPSTVSTALYHAYCKTLNRHNFYMEAFDFPTAGDYLENVLGNETPSWNDYFAAFSKNLSDTDAQQYEITAFEQFLHIGLSLTMSNEMVIRKCKPCHGYFQIRHTTRLPYVEKRALGKLPEPLILLDKSLLLNNRRNPP